MLKLQFNCQVHATRHSRQAWLRFVLVWLVWVDLPHHSPIFITDTVPGSMQGMVYGGF